MDRVKNQVYLLYITERDRQSEGMIRGFKRHLIRTSALPWELGKIYFSLKSISKLTSHVEMCKYGCRVLIYLLKALARGMLKSLILPHVGSAFE